jgi:hypothetical protein
VNFQRAIAGQPLEPDPLELAAAVQHLRRHFPNVFRCDIVLTEMGGDDRRTTVTWGDSQGLPAGGAGLHFIQNIGIVPNAVLPELARQHGWRPK